MEIIKVKTSRPKEVIDITKLVNDNLDSSSGLCHLFALHTTVGLTTADLDPGTDLDMLDAFEAIMPKLKYRHSHNPSHVSDHILSSLIGTSLLLPFENGKLVLGDWQRVVLVELNGPRARKVAVSIIKTEK